MLLLSVHHVLSLSKIGPSRTIILAALISFMVVEKSSTSFDWGYGGNVVSVGWQVKLYDPI